MAGITLAQSEQALKEYLNAQTKILKGQSYQMGDRQLTRANLREVREGIDYWQGWVDRLAPSRRLRPRTRRAIPRGQ